MLDRGCDGDRGTYWAGMPELPDVEVFNRYLSRTALHGRVEDVSVHTDKVLPGASASTVRRRLRAHRHERTRRHGKLLFVELDDDAGYLVLHFGMTGFLKYYKNDGERPEHPRVTLHLDDGYHLAFDCQRMFGEVDVCDDADEYVDERGFGPDVLSLDENAFVERLEGRGGSIKSALMNQSVMAGVGNVYSDEILFHAKIHPETKVKDLSRRDLEKLQHQTRRVLERAIDAQVDPARMPRTWLLPHRAEGEACPRCGTDLEHRHVNQRTAWLCPSCQPKSRND